MATEVRTLEVADIDSWVACLGAGFLYQPAAGEPAFRLADMDLSRTWAAYDGTSVVGTLRSFPTALTVPGPAETTAAALTNVTVAPTHRRRGLLRRMVTADLRASAERGEPLGILIASEYPIYGRYGYGAAIGGATYSVTGGARFTRQSPGSVELVTPADVRRHGPAVYERYRREQPGALGRSARWWDRRLQRIEVPGAPPWEGFQALYRGPAGTPEGYVRYRASQQWDQMRPNSTLTIDELVAATPAAYARLWQFCCEVDLVTTLEAPDRSVEEPLPWLLVDGRSVRQTGRFDFVWARVLDIGAALAARRYLCAGSVVLEVVDALGLAAGRYLLEGGPDGATCVRSDRAADLTMPVGALGSCYMGGVGLGILHATGLVDEHRAGAAATADAMFRSTVPPWCSTWF